MPRIAASFASVSVPGSHSNVISSAFGPRRRRRQPRHQPFELLRREERRRAAAEVDEVERPSGDRPAASRVELPLARHDVEVAVDLAARSCRCRRGSSRSGSACGRTGCAGTARAARPRHGGACSAGMASRCDRLRASTRRTVDRWRRSSSRLRSDRRERGPVQSQSVHYIAARKRLRAQVPADI